MNKIVGAAIAAALWMSSTVHAVERVSAFHSDIRIASGGELTVTETIEVQAAGREPRRGIVRELPAMTPLAVDKVLRNGRAEPYTFERGTRIRTGETRRMLPPGKHVYQIVYRTGRRIAFFDEHDEFSWNLGGGGGAFAVERLTAEVTFERPVPARGLRVEAFAGAQPARDHEYHAFVRDGSAAFRVTRPLAPREAMTLVVAFPKGVVVRPSLLERAGWYLSANRGVPVGAGMLALMLAFLFACRRRLAYAAAAGSRSPRNAPPEGVGPAGVRFIDRRRYDARCLSAALLGLESRGYLRIRDHGERFRLERTGHEIDWLPGEEVLAQRLLPREHADLRKHGRAIEEATGAFSRALREAFGRRRWTGNGSFVLAAAGIGLTGVLAMIALDTPRLPMALLAGAMALALAVFAVRLLPVYRRCGSRFQDEIDALRAYLSSDVAKTDEEFARLLPYAVALDLEKVLVASCPSAAGGGLAGFADLSAPGSDKSPALPRRPLRHSRSAAA